MKVLVSVPVNAYTGYGNDGISLCRALIEWGADVYLAPSSVHPPLPRDVAALLAKTIPEEVDLTLSHRCPQELARPESVGLRSHSTVALAWTMHEWDSLDNIDELNPNNCEHAFRVTDHLAAGLARFDAVLAYDEVSRKAFEPYAENVVVLQGGVDPPRRAVRHWSHEESPTFRFLMLGALSARKNPWAAINAFRALRGDNQLKDAQLILKTTVPGLHPAMESWIPGLKVINGLMTDAELWALQSNCHALLAPSWGEGKNIPAAQFAMGGGAVALPLVGGHAGWASPEYTFPVAYSWDKWSRSGVHGARVDEDDLAAVMLRMYSDRFECERRGRVASQVLPSMMGWDRVLERLMLRLPDIVPGPRGEEVATLMRACHRPRPSDSERDSRVRSALDPVSG